MKWIGFFVFCLFFPIQGFTQDDRPFTVKADLAGLGIERYQLSFEYQLGTNTSINLSCGLFQRNRESQSPSSTSTPYQYLNQKTGWIVQPEYRIYLRPIHEDQSTGFLSLQGNIASMNEVEAKTKTPAPYYFEDTLKVLEGGLGIAFGYQRIFNCNLVLEVMLGPKMIYGQSSGIHTYYKCFWNGQSLYNLTSDDIDQKTFNARLMLGINIGYCF